MIKFPLFSLYITNSQIESFISHPNSIYFVPTEKCCSYYIRLSQVATGVSNKVGNIEEKLAEEREEYMFKEVISYPAEHPLIWSKEATVSLEISPSVLRFPTPVLPAMLLKVFLCPSWWSVGWSTSGWPRWQLSGRQWGECRSDPREHHQDG